MHRTSRYTVEKRSVVRGMSRSFHRREFPMGARMLGAGAAMALACAAMATPQESVTYTGVASDGALGGPTNVVQTAAFTGAYTATKVRMSGTLRSLLTGTWPDDSRVQVTTPAGATFLVHPFTQSGSFTSVGTPGDVTVEIPVPIVAAGTWSFRFFESYDDGTGNDAQWDTVTFTLDDEVPPPPATLAADGSGVYHEVEDNDRKGRANVVAALGVGQSVAGNTTGTNTTTGGAASADYFRIKTEAAPPAIYKHRLALTSPTAGHTATIRGLTQTTSVVNVGTDISFQTAPTSGRTVQWYGFGRQEETYYAVTGTSSTTADYTSAYTRTLVTPVNAGDFLAGPITLDRGPGNAADIDLFVYDSGFNPVPGFQNDWPDLLTRDFAAGIYYIAWTNYNTSNDQPAPADDGYRSENVLDFPNAIANNSTATFANLDLRITDSTGPVIAPAAKSAAFDIVWFQMTVLPPGSPTNPRGTGLANPPTVRASLATLLTVHTVPGVNPPSTGLSVSADLTDIGGTASQVFYDDGTHGDVAAGDGTFSYLATVAPTTTLGSKTLPFTITDAQGRSCTGAIELAVAAAPTGGCCTTSGCTVATQYNCSQAHGVYSGNGTDCSGTLSGVLFSATDPFPIAIPDAVENGATPGAASAAIVVPAGSGTVQHLAVDVGILHTYVGDIKLKISHNGTQVPLETRPGVIDDATQTGSACNYAGTYTFFDATSGDLWAAAGDAGNATTFDIPAGNFHPAGQYSAGLPTPSLVAFDGMPFEGLWTLTAEDWWGADTGMITAFSLRAETPADCGRVCGSADFNCDGDVGTDSDIEAFFACLAGICPGAPCTSIADFNGDGDTGTDADIEAFFRVLAGGHC
jgi:subtilisin-like proprotein convertase family protein